MEPIGSQFWVRVEFLRLILKIDCYRNSDNILEILYHNSKRLSILSDLKSSFKIVSSKRSVLIDEPLSADGGTQY